MSHHVYFLKNNKIEEISLKVAISLKEHISKNKVQKKNTNLKVYKGLQWFLDERVGKDVKGKIAGDLGCNGGEGPF